MNKLRRVAIPIGRFVACGSRPPSLIFASCARAQFGPPALVAGRLSGQSASALGQNGAKRLGATRRKPPVPGTTTSVDTLNPTIQVQGPYAGSANSTGGDALLGQAGPSRSHPARAGVQPGRDRPGASRAPSAGREPRRAQRVASQPERNTFRNGRDRKSEGAGLVHFSLPGFSLPTLVGPFNYLDARANLTQTIARPDRAQQLSLRHRMLARRISCPRSTPETWWFSPWAAPICRCSRRKPASIPRARNWTPPTPSISKLCSSAASAWSRRSMPNRSQVQALTEQQRLLSLQNDLAKQKINLARLTGLPPTDQYELSDDIPFPPAPPIAVRRSSETGARAALGSESGGGPGPRRGTDAHPRPAPSACPRFR